MLWLQALAVNVLYNSEPVALQKLQTQLGCSASQQANETQGDGFRKRNWGCCGPAVKDVHRQSTKKEEPSMTPT